MKTKKMIVVCCTLIASGVSFLHAADALKCEAQTRKTEVLPFEPVQLLLCVRNTTNQVQSAKEDWSSSNMRVGKPKIGADGWEWSDIRNVREPGVGLPPPMPPWAYPTKVFQPNEVSKFRLASIFGTMGPEWRGLLSAPGKIAVRVSVGSLVSEPIEITILEPTGVDAEAVAALKENGLAVFFSEETFVASGEDKKHLARLQEFADKFKGSVYADYATLGMGLLHLKGLEKNLDAAEKCFLSVQGHAKNDLKEWATYYLATCKMAKGEKSVALKLLDGIKESKDPVLKYKADKLSPK
jgi:tetratricopeptide (TPR) repeat protein